MGTYNTANARLHRAMKKGFEVSESAQATLGTYSIVQDTPRHIIVLSFKEEPTAEAVS